MSPGRARYVRIACLWGTVAMTAACTGTQSWWHRDLQEWQGAPVSELLDAWGPPLRTLTGEDRAPMLVYEASRDLDHRQEMLRDPSARLRPDRDEALYSQRDRSECTVIFELEDDRVRVARHEGAACNIVPRDPRRRAPPRP